MFSNLLPNSTLYIFDLNGDKKILTGTVVAVSIPRPKFTSFNTAYEYIVDIKANIGGETREFKDVPNSSVATFNDFILAENKDVLGSYITTNMQNSQNIIDSVDKHKKLVEKYKEGLSELNPESRSEKEIINLNSKIDKLEELIIAMAKEKTSKD